MGRMLTPDFCPRVGIIITDFKIYVAPIVMIQCNTLIIMSLFIEQADLFFYHLCSTSPHPKKSVNNIHLNGHLSSTDYDQLIKSLGYMADYLFYISETQNLLTLRFDFTKLHQYFSAILVAEIKKRSEECLVSMSCLGENDYYLKVVGRERMNIICKWLSSQLTLTQFNFVVDLQSGIIKIKMPMVYNLTKKDGYKQLFGILFNVRFRFQKLLDQIHKLMQIISGMCSGSAIASSLEKSKLSRQNFGIHYLFNKYINAYVFICSESTHQQRYIQKELKKELNSIERIKKQFVPFGQQIASGKFYQYGFQNLTSIDEINDLKIELFEKKRIKSRIQMPALQKSKIPQENGYVLNYIKTKMPLDSYPNKTLCSGGFTTIKVLDIDYWYISSSNVGTAKMMEEIEGIDPLNKRVILKRQKSKNIREGGKSRVKHQRFILSRIKNGLSIFLPQYYLLAQKDQGYQNNILADFINFPNLYEYCQKFKLSTSFHTKIFFSIIIAQSIRYLTEYKIVHLDLKPTNIMTNRRLSLKLIDFGESYHPELKNHEPGFTMPYSAPENYKGCETYNYKNDVFSLGIIMHQFFIGKYPFYFHNSDLEEKVYSSETYSNYWFHLTQENAIHGDSVVFPLIESIIAKCLHPDPEHRPELQWIVYILRGCLDYFY